MKIKTIIFLIGLVNVLYGQTADNILVFAPKSDLLLSYIEKELAAFYLNDRKLFDRVTNLNRIYSNVRSEGTLREVIGNYSNELYQLSPEGKAIRREVEQLLTAHNYFLLVNINTLDLLVEYQFQLYLTSNRASPHSDTFILSDSTRFFPINFVQNPVQIENFIINPGDQDYAILIQDNLKKLFKGLNQPPEALITVNGSPNIRDSVYYFSNLDTIHLGSELSIDLDTPRKRWKFNWRQISPSGHMNIDPFERIVFNEDTPANDLVISNPGRYLIGLTISDGIDHSAEDTLNLEILQRPGIYINESHTFFYNYLSLFNNRPAKKKFNKQYSVACSNYYDLSDFRIYNASINSQIDSLKVLNTIIRKNLDYKSAAQFHSQNNSYNNFLSMEYKSNPFGFDLELTSVFPNDQTNEISFFLMNSQGIKSNVVNVKQEVSRRSPIDFFVSTGLRRLKKAYLVIDSLIDRRDNFSYLNTIVQINLHITKSLSISGGISVPHSETQIVNGYKIEPLLSANYRLNFHAPVPVGNAPMRWGYGIYLGFYHIELTTDPLVRISTATGGAPTGCACFVSARKVMIPEFGLELDFRLINKKRFPLYLALTVDSSLGSFNSLISRSVGLGLRYNVNGD